MTKRAVLIGCNYPGTKAELKGCINDVRRMQRCLLDRYGFGAEHIAVLVDTEGGPDAQPTGKNIRAALSDLVASAGPGDVLFVHYSGHGTRLPAETDDTGYDECIVPTDMNLITDDDFRELVNKVAEGCRLTIVSDSCHSGGLIDEAKEQIGESTRRNKKVNGQKWWALLKNFVCRSAAGGAEQQTKSKSLALSTLIEILKQKTGRHDIEAGELRPALLDIFGDDTTPKIKKLMKAMVNKYFVPLQGRNCNCITDNGILISGCQSDETSADTSPEGDASKAYGALSNAIQEIIAETGGRVSNRRLVVRARKLLKRQGFTQHPGLYCTHQYLHAPFIC